MNDNQIVEAVDHFIDSRLYNYAMMVNGSWGCGKTYFVYTTLIPHLRMDRKLDVNYISLYGIKDPDEISDKLCEQAIRDKISKVTKTNMEGKGAQIASVVIGKLLKYGLRKIDADESDFDGIQDILPNYDNNIIIFDDLERCNCDVCAVLGYINNFVEHSNASVIILANEDEIGRWGTEDNQELQMMVALNPRLEYDIPSRDFIEEINKKRSTNKANSISQLTPDQVHRARKLIFQQGTQYRKTKEKVIGITIDYSPDLQLVFQKLIKKEVRSEVLQQRLSDSVDTYVHMAVRLNHRNIRTFQFFLEKMNIIFDAIGTEAYPALNIVSEYCFRSTISRMKGEDPPKWEENEYGQQKFGFGIAPEDHPYGFMFVDDLISNNTIDCEHISEVLTNYCRIETARGSLEGDPYQKIKEWYISEDEELQSWLSGINKNIRDGRYSTIVFPEIIHYLANFWENGIFPDLCDQIFESMKAFIKEATEDKLEPFARERFILEGKTLDIYREKIKEISACFDTTIYQSSEEFWNSLATGDDWARNLYSFSGSRKGGDRTFIYWIAPKTLLDKITTSNNKELYTFREALHEVYRNGLYYDHWKDDVPHLVELYLQLGQTEFKGCIKKQSISWIRNDIRKWIKSFDPDNKLFEGEEA